MKVWLRLYGFEACSWTFVWNYLRDAFLALGDDVCDVVQPSSPTDYVEVWWGDPQFWQWSALPVKARIAIALTEAHSILALGRNKAIANLNKADLIICPSEAATVGIREAPIDVPVAVVPFGIDETEFSYVEREWLEGDLKFLHAGVTQFRKGSWLVVEAFLKAFDEHDHVQLTIASPKLSPMFTRLEAEYKHHPNIEFSSDLEESSNIWYKAHHIYVSPHLSEGYGLMPIEAMATGMVCLVSRCSAPREYFHKDYGGWIEMSEDYVPVAQCLPETSGFWRLPDIESLVAGMREAYSDRAACKSKGKRASDFVLHNLTWQHTVLGIKERVKEVIDEKSVRYTPSLQRRNVIAIHTG